jgi:hypothetical protein
MRRLVCGLCWVTLLLQTPPEQTLLVNARGSTSNAMDVSFSREMALVSQAFKHRPQDRFSAYC